MVYEVDGRVVSGVNVRAYVVKLMLFFSFPFFSKNNSSFVQLQKLCLCIC